MPGAISNSGSARCVSRPNGRRGDVSLALTRDFARPATSEENEQESEETMNRRRNETGVYAGTHKRDRRRSQHAPAKVPFVSGFHERRRRRTRAPLLFPTSVDAARPSPRRPLYVHLSRAALLRRSECREVADCTRRPSRHSYGKPIAKEAAPIRSDANVFASEIAGGLIAATTCGVKLGQKCLLTLKIAAPRTSGRLFSFF